MTAVMISTMVLCFALTVSVAVSIGLASILGIQASNANMLISVKEMFGAINKFPLAAIPFFILAGNLMETGGISRRLVEFAKSIVGGVQGGLVSREPRQDGFGLLRQGAGGGTGRDPLAIERGSLCQRSHGLAAPCGQLLASVVKQPRGAPGLAARPQQAEQNDPGRRLQHGGEPATRLQTGHRQRQQRRLRQPPQGSRHVQPLRHRNLSGRSWHHAGMRIGILR